MLELLTRGGMTKLKLSFWSLVTDLLQNSMNLGPGWFSVDDLSPLELCEGTENRMKELRGEYDVVDTPKSR